MDHNWIEVLILKRVDRCALDGCIGPRQKYALISETSEKLRQKDASYSFIFCSYDGYRVRIYQLQYFG